MKRWMLLAGVLVGLLIAGCGGGSGPNVTTPCPPNRSTLGCSLHTTKLSTTPRLGLAPRGAEFPDVSMFQGAVNWPAVAAWQRAHGWKPAAIFKVGEFTLDPQAIRNASETARLGFWRAGYWFVRNTGCTHEASSIVWAARRLGLKIVALDEEVPEALGYDPCLSSAVKAAGLIPVTYTAPGTWPGGHAAGNPAWEATYGPSFGCLVWTCHPAAWQFTDGIHGAVTSIPGIGTDDVSVDLGITKLGVPTLRVCYHHRLSRSICNTARKRVASYTRARDASLRAYKARTCDVLAQRDGWYSRQIRLHPTDSRTAARKRALVATRRAERHRACGTFRQRYGTFNQAIQRTEAAN